MVWRCLSSCLAPTSAFALLHCCLPAPAVGSVCLPVPFGAQPPSLKHIMIVPPAWPLGADVANRLGRLRQLQQQHQQQQLQLQHQVRKMRAGGRPREFVLPNEACVARGGQS